MKYPAVIMNEIVFHFYILALTLHNILDVIIIDQCKPSLSFFSLIFRLKKSWFTKMAEVLSTKNMLIKKVNQ